MLASSADNQIHLWSASSYFDFIGIYTKKTSSEEDLGWYAMSVNGGLTRITKTGTSLNPFRFFLTVTDRTDNPYLGRNAGTSSVKPQNINIVEFDDVTALKAVMANSREASNETIYDLQGRRVSKPVRGIYIQGGKKVLVK